MLSASFISVIQRRAIKLMKGLAALIYGRDASNAWRKEDREETRTQPHHHGGMQERQNHS